jgi:protein involved in polysaccharide export with SLBB domain
VKTLVEAAQGVTEDAFTTHAVMHRTKEDRTLEALSVDIAGIMEGRVADIPLRNEDVLYIATRTETQQEPTLTIHGEVQYPGIYRYAENETLEDFIVQAGGLSEAASTAKVDVSRRIIDPNATTSRDTIAQTFSFALKDGFIIDGEQHFHLMPFDEVYVRKSPGYTVQQNVAIEGEVLFEGTYTLTRKNMRLSEVIKNAGGLTKTAYAQGARLVRTRTAEERLREEDLQKMVRRQNSANSKDSLNLSTLEISPTYTVGIELDKAIASPGSDADIALREGDRIIVPEFTSTVKINGEVMYPNTVSFIEGKSIDYYINQAGGYSNNAKSSRTYIIYMNGNVAKPDRKHRPQPGCEIVVPSKVRGNRMSTAEVLAIGTSTASIATMIATLVNLFK